jgi:hypothetical protein
MFEPERKSHWYLVFVAVVAGVIGWSIHTHYKPLMIRATCSEIATKSSGLVFDEEGSFDSDYTYQKMMRKCLEDSGIR